jgi:hypothetical protein
MLWYKVAETQRTLTFDEGVREETVTVRDKLREQ